MGAVGDVFNDLTTSTGLVGWLQIGFTGITAIIIALLSLLPYAGYVSFLGMFILYLFVTIGIPLLLLILFGDHKFALHRYEFFNQINNIWTETNVKYNDNTLMFLFFYLCMNLIVTCVGALFLNTLIDDALIRRFPLGKAKLQNNWGVFMTLVVWALLNIGITLSQYNFEHVKMLGIVLNIKVIYYVVSAVIIFVAITNWKRAKSPDEKQQQSEQNTQNNFLSFKGGGRRRRRI